jgi:hypothetical protein
MLDGGRDDQIADARKDAGGVAFGEAVRDVVTQAK